MVVHTVAVPAISTPGTKVPGTDTPAAPITAFLTTSLYSSLRTTCDKLRRPSTNLGSTGGMGTGLGTCCVMVASPFRRCTDLCMLCRQLCGVALGAQIAPSAP